MLRKILLLGATGTIGKNTIEIVRKYPTEFTLSAIVANNNFKELSVIANEFRVPFVAISNERFIKDLKALLTYDAKIIVGNDAIISELCSQHFDILVSAIPGFEALKPTVAAIPNCDIIALANKECIVAAGDIIKNLLNLHKKTLIPVDSEHNSIFQLIDGNKTNNKILNITITASGGPFLKFSSEQLKSVTTSMALTHPNWRMGPKNTLDSATLANKGLEVIEAKNLFNLSPNQIDAIIHPQSIVHAMVTFIDGTNFWNCYKPDMKVPISHAISYPNRIFENTNHIDLKALNSLTFEEPDYNRFPLLKTAIDILKEHNSYAVAFNAANEVAGSAFLNEQISFLNIANLVLDTLNSCIGKTLHSIEELTEYNNYVVTKANGLIKKFK